MSTRVTVTVANPDTGDTDLALIRARPELPTESGVVVEVRWIASHGAEGNEEPDCFGWMYEWDGEGFPFLARLYLPSDGHGGCNDIDLDARPVQADPLGHWWDTASGLDAVVINGQPRSLLG
jgi:hypothetical protein